MKPCRHVHAGVDGGSPRTWVCALLVILWSALAAGSAQTGVGPLRSGFTPEEEVRRGREAAEGVHLLLPMLRDPDTDGFVRDIGRRLAANIPAELRQPRFRYSFEVVNVTDLISYAFAGGPIFVSRGMIETAQTEAALAGLLAHQLSHVVLRHGAAQATSGETFELGDLAGQELGAIALGTEHPLGLPGVIFGISMYSLEYVPAFEREANLLGRQIMTRAGYDPRQVAEMFRTIARTGADRGGPAWIKGHSDPGDGDQDVGADGDISRRAAGAPQATPVRVDRFGSMRARLRAMAPAQTAENASRAQASQFTDASVGEVVVPSGGSRRVTVGNVLQADVPANWRRLSGTSAVVFAPTGGLFAREDLVAFTHGVQIGVARSPTGDLEGDTQALLQRFGETNADFQWTPAYQRIRLGGRSGLTAAASRVSAATERFVYVSVSTTHLRDGSLVYVIGVAPRGEAGTYRNAFDRIQRSIRFVD